jgi:hypothetical protein
MFTFEQNPSAVPNPEQTASIFSLAVYAFVSDTIQAFSKAPASLPSDVLPLLADYDTADVLAARSFKVSPSTPSNQPTISLTCVCDSTSTHFPVLTSSIYFLG